MARFSFSFQALTLAVFAAGFMALPAQAGFEFVGSPPASSQPSAAPPVYPEWGRPDMGAPAASGGAMSMTPAPAADVVGQALDSAAYETRAPMMEQAPAPQSMMAAPAPVAPSAYAPPPAYPSYPVAPAMAPSQAAPVYTPPPAPAAGYVPSAQNMMMAAPQAPAYSAPMGLVSQAPDTAPMPAAPRAVQAMPNNLTPPPAPAPQQMAPVAPVASVEMAPPAPAPEPVAAPASYNPVPRYIRRDPAAAAPNLSMNPPPAAPANITDSAVEQAMLAVSGGVPMASAASPPRSGFGGMPLPSGTDNPYKNYSEAVGFGRDLPLALAVSQILPPDYAFSFGQDINPGDSVSWEGGRPWNIVLNDALASVGAHASIDDSRKEVTISGGGASAPTYQPAAYQAPVPRAPEQNAAPAAASSAPAINMAPAIPASAPVPVPQAQTAPVPTIKLAGTTSGSAFDINTESTWTAERGTSLRAILTDWSMRAGVELFWSSEFDFPVESTIRITGTFEEAVQTLLTGLRDAQPRPVGRLHPNLPDGPSVLVIETQHVIQ